MLTGRFGDDDERKRSTLMRKSTSQQGNNLSAESPMKTQQTFNPSGSQEDASKSVLYETIVKKKNFFYNQRQIVFYQDGSFSYSKKGQET
jgi:hypothetical protein